MKQKDLKFKKKKKITSFSVKIRTFSLKSLNKLLTWHNGKDSFYLLFRNMADTFILRKTAFLFSVSRFLIVQTLLLGF